MAVATFKGLQSGRLFGYLARRPGNRATTARCPRGRAGTRRVQEVGARGWRCRNGEKMADERLSAADRALRDTNYRVLCAHPVRRTPRSAAAQPAGLPGPADSVAVVPATRTHRRNGTGAMSHDSSTCASSASGRRRAEHPAGRGGLARTAGMSTSPSDPVGVSARWRSGRHSLMNGIGVRGGAPPEVQRAQIDRLMAFAQRR